jgi:hypothetical protein
MGIFGPGRPRDRALRKLARLRLRAQRFKGLRQAQKKLWSPNLEKALAFLDDSLLPPTSNAVERTNRRHCKTQKTIYCLGTKAQVYGRTSPGCLREARTRAREEATQVLHLQRAA